MDWLVKGFPHLVLYVFGGLLLALVPVLFCLLLKRAGVLDRFSEATHWLSTCSRLEQMFIVCFVIVFIVVGSVKPGGGSTNDLGRASLPRLARGLPVGDVILPVDVVRGWRVAGTDGNGPVDMPAGAVTNDLLRRRGGHDWAFRVEPEGFRAPCRDGFIEGVTVFARGEVRPDVGTLYYPVPLTNGVSLLPEVRWGMLSRADGGEVSRGGAEARSVFSHAVTTNGSLLLDWRNALVGRDPNSPTNLQMELFADGGFVWRTDGGSTSYLPVFPFDWDNDGLENSVDPAPLSPNPVDAHGTPPEWYRVVCSNVFTVADDSDISQFPDSDISFRPEVNTNAYYFVDVVASAGPAPIRFNADRDSRLGSPVVVARAAETNRVPLLIGVEYAVTSTVPFSVTLQEGGFAETNRQGGCSVTVKWQLDFAFVGDADAPGAYTVAVVPYDPGVTFTWNSPASGGGASLLSAASPSPSSCACWGGSGPSVVFDCSDHCDCGGGCQASGTGSLEDAEFAVTGGVCRCSRPDEPHEDTPPPPDPLVGGLLISFSERAVIFEDAYRNTEDGPLVPRQSTTTRLTVSASGGPLGGSFSLTTRNLEKLIAANGPGPVTLTSGMTLGPYETYSATFECAGIKASGSENDVEVEGTFTEAVTGWTESPRARATVVEVEIKPQMLAPANQSDHRHTFGVYELVDLIHTPSIDAVEWTLQGGGGTENSEEGYVGNSIFGGCELRCPLYDNGASLKVSCRGVDYYPTVRFVEPQGVETRNAVGLKGVYPTNICGASMKFDMYVTPMTVSFGEISIEEIPSEDILFDLSTCSGYFMDDPPGRKSHTYEMGAGRWNGVRSADNYIAPDTVDTDILLAVDRDGTMSWYIPMGWHRKGAVQGEGRHLPFREFAPYTYWQNFFVYENGDAMVQKHGHWCWRNLQDDVWLDGREVQ